MTRASSKVFNPSAMAKAKQTNTANPRNANSTRLGPNRSSHRPMGNWVKAKPKKYPPASKPKSPALNPISLLNTGEIVAVTARIKVDKK
jgi:hypothetical protein